MKPKNELVAASNALAYQARKLRNASLDPDLEAVSVASAVAPSAAPVPDVVDRLRALGAAEIAERDAERDRAGIETVAPYAALVQRARAQIAENVAAEREHGPLIRRLAALPWNDVRARAKNTVVPGSAHDTWTRLGLLQRTVGEAAAILFSTDDELKTWLREVEGFTGREKEREREYAAKGLRHTMGDRAGSIHSKAAAIERLLKAIESDLDAADAATIAGTK